MAVLPEIGEKARRLRERAANKAKSEFQGGGVSGPAEDAAIADLEQ